MNLNSFVIKFSATAQHIESDPIKNIYIIFLFCKRTLNYPSSDNPFFILQHWEILRILRKLLNQHRVFQVKNIEIQDFLFQLLST